MRSLAQRPTFGFSHRRRVGNPTPTRTRLFTTNYDLCFEEAARRHRFTIIDGFQTA